jgi:hypothetical protein
MAAAARGSKAEADVLRAQQATRDKIFTFTMTALIFEKFEVSGWVAQMF